MRKRAGEEDDIPVVEIVVFAAPTKKLVGESVDFDDVRCLERAHAAKYGIVRKPAGENTDHEKINISLLYIR